VAEDKEWHFDRDEQRRQKLQKMLKVAAECFNEKGFSGTSLKDVARKLNITDAALYYYVKNKEELVNLCYVHAVNLAESAFDRATAEGETPLEVLRLYIRYQIDVFCGPEGPVTILSEIPALTPEHRDLMKKRTAKHAKRITALVEAGVANGSMTSSNPVAAGDALMGALNWIPKWYRPNSLLSGEEIAESFIETFTLGLEARR
jgi:AcrR family transcriptional regulator